MSQLVGVKLEVEVVTVRTLYCKLAWQGERQSQATHPLSSTALP